MINSNLKSANILIVDDQESNIYVLEAFLSIQGYTNVKTTTDPRKVVHLFASFDPDLILLDLMMPHLSGFEVMDQLKSLISSNTYLPILVLTADITSETKRQALSGGASDFVTKPFDLEEVGMRIKNLLLTSYLQQQLLNQNQILEERVKSRTSELEKKNIELQAAKEKAEASDRLKSSFINNISHEIRTPLNGILGFTEILADPDLSPDEREQYFAMLNSSSDRLINTITNFLDISLLATSNQKIYKKEIRLTNLMIENTNRFKEACQEKNLLLSLQTPSMDDDLIINTDGELLGKIFNHLIDNAVKFTQQGSITVGYEMKDGELQFFVKDSGIGIYDENRKKIFGYFVQENSANTRGYEGSGLGLTIAKGFIELLDGKIWVVSEKGKGSTFYFSLPMEDSIASHSLQSKNNNLKTNLEIQTILVAEDDEFNFIYINILLKHDLFKILHAQNGVEAVEFCQTHPEIVLVLMDLKMPVMDGFEATRQIKLLRNNLPVIAVTAYSGTEDQQRALEAGCDDLITKPLKKDFLYKKLEEFGIIIT
jgi:signal transduction histidine kinase